MSVGLYVSVCVFICLIDAAGTDSKSTRVDVHLCCAFPGNHLVPHACICEVCRQSPWSHLLFLMAAYEGRDNSAPTLSSGISPPQLKKKQEPQCSAEDKSWQCVPNSDHVTNTTAAVYIVAISQYDCSVLHLHWCCWFVYLLFNKSTTNATNGV